MTPVFTNNLATESGLYVKMPVTGTKTIDFTKYIAKGLTSFNVYDDGGKDGDFSYDADGYLTLSAPKGYALQVTGTVESPSASGYLTIYDGNSEATRLLDAAYGVSVNVISTDNVLTLYFKSTANLQFLCEGGFDLLVTLLPPPYGIELVEVTGGTVEADPATARQDETVELTITPDANNDYLFNGIKVVKKGTTEEISVNTTNVYAKTGGKASFTMPASDVTVTPSWGHGVTVVSMNGGTVTTDKTVASEGETVTLTISTDVANGYVFNDLTVKDAANNIVDVTTVSTTKKTFTMTASKVTVTPSWRALLIEDGEGGYYVNMPVSGTNTLDLAEYIANGVTSFKVYDDGGKDGNFTDGAKGYLEMTAPAGYQFIIQGSMNATCDGGSCVTGELNIFDGNSSATRILQKWGNVSSINKHSTGNTMTLYFTYGSGSGRETASGLDFTVTVFTPHGVNIVGVEGGRVSTDKGTADEGTMVTLTATPNEGYMLNGISVVDIDGKSVDGTWNIGANTFTFNMPAEAVFVTPLFVPVGDVFVNIPKTGNMEVVIPEGMESIKVYDDGGKDGNYSDQSNAILQLIAPENYVFQISGSVTTEYFRDFLSIYDGDKVHDNFLMLGTINNESVDLNGANILTSSNNVITLRFYSNDYTNKSGFDLKVTLVKPSYGAVTFAKADNGVFSATINGAYAGTDTLVIPEAISVDAVEYVRSLEAGVPATALLPVALPAGTTVNADFYTLEKVEQVDNGWHAVMRYIGNGNLPQANTPYAFILNDGETALEFDLKGHKATVQTGEINKVCAFEDACTLDGEGQVENDWFFTGTYAYKVWDTDNGELGLAYAFAATDNPGGAAKGRFGKIAYGAYANPLRAYLRKRDASVQLVAAARGLVAGNKSFATKNSLEYSPETIDVEFVKASIDGNEETTFVGRLNTRTGEFKMLRNYDLKGRMLNGKPKARGAYYGKRVINK